MRVIIAGGRDIRLSPDEVQGIVIDSGFSLDVKEVVSGGAGGIDASGEAWAASSLNGSDLNISRFPADWNAHGKAAGPIRNRQMADYADALILIWDGKSRGSMSMRKEAIDADLKIHEHIVNN